MEEQRVGVNSQASLKGDKQQQQACRKTQDHGDDEMKRTKGFETGK